MPATPTYTDAPESLILRWQERRAPLRFDDGEILPPLDADLALLATRPVPLSLPPLPDQSSTFAAKRHALAVELAGQSELALLQAVLIACLRKRAWPGHAPALFRRIWAEQAGHLLSTLSPRWLISAAITFADHGESEPQRRLGQSLNLLFSLMKLYEYERLFSGHAPDRPFPLRGRAAAPLPLGMPGFSLDSGGLDINLLAPLWREAQAEPVLGPLACHLLHTLNHDPGTLFRRLGKMRKRRERTGRRADPAPDP